MMTRNKLTGLTPKQEVFCVELVKSSEGNATAAYRAAYNTDKSTSKTICESARKLLKKPKVIARIAELRARVTEKQELTIEEVLEEVRRIAFVDPLTIYGADGKVLPMEDIPEGTRHAIASLVIKANGETIVKFCEKTQALDRLMRFLGMYEKDNAQHRNPFDGMPPELVKEIQECLIEIVRVNGLEQPPGLGGGGLTH
jgi:phage terminase small subunit